MAYDNKLLSNLIICLDFNLILLILDSIFF